jgi:D-amino-acid dehydrogenase
MSKKVIVIGGGIIGLCSAYYLQKEGHQVMIVYQSNLDSGASYINAGYLSPSHFIPLAAPGMMKKGIQWMFNPASPLYIKPRLEADFLKWSWAFSKSCSAKNVQKAIKPIKEITLLSQQLFDEIKETEGFTFHYEKKGLLILCQTEKMLEAEIKIANLANSEGLEAKIIPHQNELKALQPNTKINAIGAVHYHCDFHTTPHEFMEEMKTFLKTSGVQFYTNEKVEALEISNQKIIAIKTDKNKLTADEFVLASGSWTPQLSKQLGVNLLIQAGKGYCINSMQNTGITIPAILAEAKIAITPMNGFTRFAGTMEIAGVNHNINKERVETIAKSTSRYYPKVTISEEEKQEAACGLRPVTPDGLPFIGRSKKCNNLTIASGHAMMGWSMATATGKIVSEIISENKTSLDIAAFHPDRRFKW